MSINIILCQKQISFSDQITGWIDKRCSVILNEMFNSAHCILIKKLVTVKQNKTG